MKPETEVRNTKQEKRKRNKGYPYKKTRIYNIIFKKEIKT
jgi:hypothetical protein